MLRICFDEEVDSELVESFRKSLQRLRWPQTVFGTFAFAAGVRSNVSRTLSQRHQSIKKSQKSLTNTANLAKKKVVQNRGSLRRPKNGATGENDKRNDESEKREEDSDEEASDEDHVVKRENNAMKIVTPVQNFDVLGEDSLCVDYERIGLGSVTKLVIGSPWRLSMANLKYNVCRGCVFSCY